MTDEQKDETITTLGVMSVIIPNASLLDIASVKSVIKPALADFPGARIEVKHSDSARSGGSEPTVRN